MPHPMIEEVIKGALRPGVESTPDEQKQAGQQHSGDTTEDKLPYPDPLYTMDLIVGLAMNADLAVMRQRNFR
jgi:hypothetical protein